MVRKERAKMEKVKRKQGTLFWPIRKKGAGKGKKGKTKNDLSCPKERMAKARMIRKAGKGNGTP